MVTHRQLAAVGLSGNALTRRVAAGRLVRLYRGVFAVGHVQQTRESRWIAAVMACGPGAVLSHLDAAALWRIYDASVPTRRRVYTIDCLWREERVAVELDGRAAHVRAAAFEADRARDTALVAVGLIPLRFTWRRVTGEPDDVLGELEAALLGRR